MERESICYDSEASEKDYVDPLELPGLESLVDPDEYPMYERDSEEFHDAKLRLEWKRAHDCRDAATQTDVTEKGYAIQAMNDSCKCQTGIMRNQNTSVSVKTGYSSKVFVNKMLSRKSEITDLLNVVLDRSTMRTWFDSGINSAQLARYSVPTYTRCIRVSPLPTYTVENENVLKRRSLSSLRRIENKLVKEGSAYGSSDLVKSEVQVKRAQKVNKAHHHSNGMCSDTNFDMCRGDKLSNAISYQVRQKEPKKVRLMRGVMSQSVRPLLITGKFTCLEKREFFLSVFGEDFLYCSSWREVQRALDSGFNCLADCSILERYWYFEFNWHCWSWLMIMRPKNHIKFYVPFGGTMILDKHNLPLPELLNLLL